MLAKREPSIKGCLKNHSGDLKGIFSPRETVFNLHKLGPSLLPKAIYKHPLKCASFKNGEMLLEFVVQNK